MGFQIPLFISCVSWPPHFVEYKSKTQPKLEESLSTKSKPWPDWGRYTHYNMEHGLCIWLFLLAHLGPNSWFWRGLRKLKPRFFLDLYTVLSSKNGEKLLGVWFCSELRWLKITRGDSWYPVISRDGWHLTNKLIPKQKKWNSATTKLKSQKS